MNCKSSIIPNQRIDLHTLHIIQLFQRLPNLPLIRLDIHNKHQRIILLNLLHRTLRIQRMDDDFAGIEAGCMWDALARVLGRAGEGESLGSVEGGVVSYFADLVRVDLL